MDCTEVTHAHSGPCTVSLSPGRLLAVVFAFVICLGFVPRLPGRGPDSLSADERALKDAGISTETPALLDFMRKRTLDDGGYKRVQQLVTQLGDQSFRLREKASAELISLGSIAIPFLHQSLRSSDLEVIRRSEECLRVLAERDQRGLPGMVARVLAARKAPGAAEVLLGYLPFAEGESVAQEVQTALLAAGSDKGQPLPVVLEALNDKFPVRRSAAAEVIWRTNQKEHQPRVRKLLEDPEPTVRLRVALMLAHSKEKEAIPVLIALLTQVTPARAWEAEDVLLRLAGDDAPLVDMTRDEKGRQKCQQAWMGWWQTHRDKADLAQIDAAVKLRGYTMLVLLNEGKIVELDEQDKPRMEISGLSLPLDAQSLPGDRILVAEHDENRVTERNRKGEILWQHRVDLPLMAQRLSNGHTFIAAELQMLEVDREGRDVFVNYRQGEKISKARKLPNGDIALILLTRRYVRLDPGGKELASFPVNVGTYGGRVDILPNGHVLVPEMNLNRVVEYDANGQVVWQIPFEKPVAAARLPNGNTLVTAYQDVRAWELDREGKIVWEYKAGSRVTRAFRR